MMMGNEKEDRLRREVGERILEVLWYFTLHTVSPPSAVIHNWQISALEDQVRIREAPFWPFFIIIGNLFYFFEPLYLSSFS